MINYGVHTCSSRFLFHVYKCYRWGREYHPTTFYSQLSMTNHNFANFSQRKDNTTDLPTPKSAVSMCFMPPDVIRTTHARIVQGPDDLSARYIMPLDEAKRRKEGAPCMVASLEIKKN